MKQKLVLGIRIRIRLFLGLQDPDLDPLVSCTIPDPDPSLLSSSIERTEMLASNKKKIIFFASLKSQKKYEVPYEVRGTDPWIRIRTKMSREWRDLQHWSQQIKMTSKRWHKPERLRRWSSRRWSWCPRPCGGCACSRTSAAASSGPGRTSAAAYPRRSEPTHSWILH